MPVNYMDYSQAYSQAQQALQPQFNQQMQNLGRQQVSRGFYGQLPGDVMQQQLGTQQVGQTAQYAQQLQDADWQRGFQQAQLALQQEQMDMQQQQQEQERRDNFWRTIGGVAGTVLGGPIGGAIGGYVTDRIFS